MKELEDHLISPKSLPFKSPLSVSKENSFCSSSAVNFESEIDSRKNRLVFLNKKNELYCGNEISTTQYTLVNFVPKFLFDRFSRLANMYFLCVGIGQMIPDVSSTNGIPMQYIPLSIVLFIDALFTILQDIRRFHSDKRVNLQGTLKFNNHKKIFEQELWMNLKVGDIICVKNHEALPSDVLVLSVSELDDQERQPTGICFVETKSLDGETNLKVKEAMTCTFSSIISEANISELVNRNIYIKTEEPNHDINQYSGIFIIPESKCKAIDAEEENIKDICSEMEFPIDLKNILLRGSTLRNISYVYAVVLSTGKETKVMKSSTIAPTKEGQIVKLVNRLIGGIIALLIFLSIIGTTLNTIWSTKNNTVYWYLFYGKTSSNSKSNDKTATSAWFIDFFYYALLMAAFVPITLYVSLVIVSNFQSYFIEKDLELYDEHADIAIEARNSSLNDQLGQIKYIFSDKTGTLTCNVMQFRKMSINGVQYGKGTTEIGRVAAKRNGKRLSLRDLMADKLNCNSSPSQVNVNFIDPMNEFQADYTNMSKGVAQKEKMDQFLAHLAICHSVILEKCEDSKEKTFSASSPDELGLVCGASFLGCEFIERTLGAIKIKMTRSKEIRRFDVLNMLEFTSKRKRMSIIVRDENGKIYLYTKGADNILLPKCLKNTENDIRSKTEKHLEDFAEEGLRTLVLCMKELTIQEYDAWSKKYEDVVSDMDEIEKKSNDEANEIDKIEDEIESNLCLLGATGIEDKLQEGVSTCIQSLKEANIKLWVLTGDKEETAINIGFACEILSNDMQRVVINLKQYPTELEIQRLLYSYLDSEVVSTAIIVDGDALSMILDKEITKDLFLEVAQFCSVVIACRVSPKQKAQLVLLVKNNIKDTYTLAIGDGANDVSMIQAAHIGVGISGQEGRQAVNASDFSISQFFFLRRLLLVHGTWNYFRIARLVLFIFYKNILFQTSMYLYGIYAAYSGTRFYYNLWLQSYNLLYTTLPALLFAIFDKKTPESMAIEIPQLYKAGQKNAFFNSRVFVAWVVEALIQAVILFFIPTFVHGYTTGHNVFNYWDCGGVSFSALIIVVNMKLVLNMTSFSYINFAGFLLTAIAWLLTAIVIDLYFSPEVSHGAFPFLFSQPQYYLIVILTVVTSLLRDFIWKAWKREKYPEYYHIAQEISSENLFDDYEAWDTSTIESNRDFVFKCNRENLPTSVLNSEITRKESNIHRGFAFSTDTSSRHNSYSRFFVQPSHVQRVKQNKRNRIFPDIEYNDPSQLFVQNLNNIPISKQEVWENERYDVFNGWSGEYLTPFDPKNFSDKAMKISFSDFNTDLWQVDSTTSNSSGWLYAKDFFQFKIKKRSRRGINISTIKNAGSNVRRRKWVRKRLSSPCC